MYILNKKTNVIQECSNMDVIKTCRRNVDLYQVAEKKEELVVVKENNSSIGKEKTLEEMNVSELRAFAKEKGLEGCSGLNKENLLEVLKDVV